MSAAKRKLADATPHSPYARERGKVNREDPVHARFEYDAHKRKHPVDRLRELQKKLNDALDEVQSQASKTLRGRAETEEYHAAMQAAATFGYEIQESVTLLLAVMMQMHPNPWKLTP